MQRLAEARPQKTQPSHHEHYLQVEQPIQTELERSRADKVGTCFVFLNECYMSYLFCFSRSAAYISPMKDLSQPRYVNLSGYTSIVSLPPKIQC